MLSQLMMAPSFPVILCLGQREGGRKDRDPESNDEINAGYRTRILNANWRDVTTDAKSTIGKPRDQLENRMGLQVAVLKL